MEKLFKGLFNGKKILITGHTGFKGSWMALWLRELGASVIGFSLEPPSDPSHFEVIGLEKHMVHTHGDVRHKDQLIQFLDEHKPEYVFHFAAQSIVRASYIDPHTTYETNIMGTVNMLEAVRNTPGIRVCQIITSDKCYENNEWVYSYRENDPMGGHDPYSSSKGCSELVTAAFMKSFFNPECSGNSPRIATVRAGNVIGGGDWAVDRLIPDSVRALIKEEQITIRNPKAIRPWQHVLETLSGYLWLAVRMEEDGEPYTGAWNFGPDSTDIHTVADVVERVIDRWDHGSYTVEKEEKGEIKGKPFHEACFLKLDSTKAHNLLGWQPVYDLEKALDVTVQWYKTYYKNLTSSEMYGVSRDQIHEYTKAARSKKLIWTLN